MAADAHPPAAVAVPAQRFHHAALHGDNGRALAAQKIVTQVLALEAKRAAGSKIVVMGIVKAFRNGAERFQSVLRQPLPILLDGVAAKKTAQHSAVGLLIIAEILASVPHDFLGIAS